MAPAVVMSVLEGTDGPATVLAISTANPADYVHQADYPDCYFRVTNSDHLPKRKFTKLCKLMED